MNMQPGVWCGVLFLSAGLAVAESGKKDTPYTKINPEAAELIGTIKPAVPPSNAQQGNNQQGQFPPGQGPNNNVPVPAQLPSGVQNQPSIPSAVPDSVKDAAVHEDAVRAAAEVRATIESMRQVPDGIDLGILDADQARNRPEGLDPATLGMQPDDMEAARLIEQIQKVTGGSNHDGWSDTTQAYADSAGLTPDLGAIKAGRAQDGGEKKPARDPNDGGTTKWSERNSDGTTTEHYEQSDENGGLVLTRRERRQSDGTVISSETRERRGDQVVEHSSTLIPGSGDYAHSTSVWTPSGGSRPFQSWRSPDPRYSVDPDSAYGGGGGWLPGKAPKSVLEKAKDSHTPGGRPPSPDDQGGVGGPRVNLDVDLVGQPNPDQAAGGSAVGSMIKNPNDDTVDPPPPIR
jgi:hypothetical protein